MSPEVQHLIDTLKNAQDPFTWMFLAVVVGAVVRILKTKAVNNILDAIPFTKRIPKDALPWVAVGLATAITFLDAKLNTGLTWRQSAWAAVCGAVFSGGGAVGGHETVAKLVGRIIYSKPDDGSGPPSPLPKIPNSTIPPGDYPRATMRIAFAATFVMLSACSLFGDPKTAAKTVLSIADIVCIETGNGSAITNAKEAATACRIIDAAPELIDLIDKLIGQREAGKRAGYVWHPQGVTETVTDAGARDAGRDATR